MLRSRRASLPIRPVGVRFATWNVHGCKNEVERVAIDTALQQHDVEVACIQETHLPSCQTSTPTYEWYLSGGRPPALLRGCGILVRRDAAVEVLGFEAVSDSVCAMRVRMRERVFLLVSVNGRSASLYSQLVFNSVGCVLAERADKYVVVAGDLNAQIGINDLTPEDLPYIGENLHHSSDNVNAIMVKALAQAFELYLRNTMESHVSTRVTHIRRNAAAQPDHILTNWPFMRCMTTKWGKHHVSEHKILLCVIRLWPLVRPRSSTQSWISDAAAAVMSAMERRSRSAAPLGRTKSPTDLSPVSADSRLLTPSTTAELKAASPVSPVCERSSTTTPPQSQPCTLVRARVFEQEVAHVGRTRPPPVRKAYTTATCTAAAGTPSPPPVHSHRAPVPASNFSSSSPQSNASSSGTSYSPQSPDTDTLLSWEGYRNKYRNLT